MITAPEILLVEDDPDELELALEALQETGLQHALAVARDGADALDFLLARGRYLDRADAPAPRLVLLDLQLPRVGGIEVLRTLKSDARTRHIPVVVLTSSRVETDLETCYALGANSYVVKPVDLDQFVQALAEVGSYWMELNEGLPR